MTLKVEIVFILNVSTILWSSPGIMMTISIFSQTVENNNDFDLRESPFFLHLSKASIPICSIIFISISYQSVTRKKCFPI